MTGRFGYTHGSVLRRDRVYIAGVALELEEQDVPHAILFSLPGQVTDSWYFEHRLAGLLGLGVDGVDTALTIGEDGHLEWADDEGATDARISDEAGWPTRQRLLRGLSDIDGTLFAFGAGRQVHRWNEHGRRWQRHDEGCRAVAGSGDAGSFHALAGHDADHLLAAGLGGELWRCVSGSWSTLASPTRSMLLAIAHMGDDRYLAAGLDGTVLEIDGDHVQRLSHAHANEPFCGMAAAFGGHYLCSESGALFHWDGHDLARVDVAADPDGGGQLSSADDTLLWVTASQVRRFDGTAWEDITPE